MLWMLMGVAAGAPNCTKGKPCGNSCISWDKTCHIGSYSPSFGPSSYSPPPELVRELASVVITRTSRPPGLIGAESRKIMLAAVVPALKQLETDPQGTVATLLSGVDPDDYGLSLEGEELLGLFPAHRVHSLGNTEPGLLVVSTWGLQFFPWDGTTWGRSGPPFEWFTSTKPGSASL
jgi:hypothetical protein